MKRLLFISTLLLLLVLTALAAFISVETFDSYSTSSDLLGANGGSGWTGAWTAGGGGDWIVGTAPAGGQGGNAVKNVGVNAFEMIRGFTAITSGTASWRAYLTITNPDDFMGVVLMEGATGKMFVRLGPAGNVEIYDSAIPAYVTVAAYSASTWVTIDIDFNAGTQPNLYRARVNNGTYSGYKTVETGSYTNIDGIRLESTDTGVRDFWIDDIKTPSAASSVVPILNSLRRRRP